MGNKVVCSLFCQKQWDKKYSEVQWYSFVVFFQQVLRGMEGLCVCGAEKWVKPLIPLFRQSIQIKNI